MKPIIFAALLCLAAPLPAMGAGADWSRYGGSADGTRSSTLTQITKDNVKSLAQAWTFEMDEGGDPQTHPLAIDGVVYAYTPSLKTIALDGATGKLLWTFDPGIAAKGAQRGLTWWSDGHDRRLFASCMHMLFALDPATGKPIESFGTHGHIDLRKGMGRDPDSFYLSLTTPGVIWKDMIITGFRTGESAPAAPGMIRAFDVHTGKLRWSFRTIPAPGQPGHGTWPADAWKTAGGANSWAGMVIDTARGIVYAPTGSAVNDFYGADRKGDNLYANSLLALDANTGKLLWHFQGMHHDILDRDFPSPPVLLTVKHDGRMVDAVAQPTKQGYLFVLDRVTGKPVFPVTETPVPQSDVPGEVSSPTQPVPALPKPFARQALNISNLTNRTEVAHQWALMRLNSFNSNGPFAPLKVSQSTVVMPGFDGGAEWGGSAADTKRGILYLNANDIAWTGALAPAAAAHSLGAATYQANCAPCHGPDRKGSPPAFPSLVKAVQFLSPDQITGMIHHGAGRMPAFTQIQGETLTALLQFLISGEDAGPPAKQEPGGAKPQPYRFTGYKKFLDPDGYPAVAPPWGTLNAIDLNTGDYLWRIPLGEYPELAAKGMVTGSENYGGPILTDAGLLFIGATIYDKKIRAFDASNGDLLWQATLPYAGNATPITYMAGGRQFVLIQADNARDRKAKQGAAYVAFALPQ
ncbi:MAG: PQQ-binding-like beta-propeller repeat protein [Alphaproteobacteria bacterium]|nr:PQQ-binding-like beta-propeller repeat protein [Alphaproteobacteria bacterium]